MISLSQQSEFIKELISQELVPKNCKRVVIDCQVGDPIMLHYETYADERIVNVLRNVRLSVTAPHEVELGAVAISHEPGEITC